MKTTIIPNGYDPSAEGIGRVRASRYWTHTGPRRSPILYLLLLLVLAVVAWDKFTTPARSDIDTVIRRTREQVKWIKRDYRESSGLGQPHDSGKHSSLSGQPARRRAQ